MRLFVLLILLASLAGLANAELKVIYDNKKTVPTRPFLDALIPPKLNRADILADIERQRQDTLRKLPSIAPKMFPVRTPELSPGGVIHRKVALPNFPQPLCLIGDDELSYKWLAKNASSLAKHGTVCLIVNVQSEARAKLYKDIAGNLQILPAKASIFAHQLHLTHYPVLITSNRVGQ